MKYKILNSVNKILATLLISTLFFTYFGFINVNADDSNTTIKHEIVDPSVNGEEGYKTITTINGTSYKDYIQGTYPKGYNQAFSEWGISSEYSFLKLPGCNCSFGAVGCGPTSTAVILSGYGIKGGVGEKALPFVCGKIIGTYDCGTDNCNWIKKAFDKYDIPTTVYSYNKTDAQMKIIDNALKEGRPIVFNVNGRNNRYAPGGHYIAALGYDKDGYLIISNPCYPGLYGSKDGYKTKLREFYYEYLNPTFLITNKAPTEPFTVSDPVYNKDNSTVDSKRTVTITANKKIASASGSISGEWTVNGNTITKEYTQNTSKDIVTITDKNGSTIKKTVNVSNIDNSVSIKSRQVIYNPSEKTNAQKVNAKIIADEALEKVTNSSVTWTVSGKTATADYTSNKRETIKIWDKYGNSTDIEVNVNNIDRQVPQIVKIQKCIDSFNYENVVVTANKPIDIYNAGNSIISSHEVEQSMLNYMKNYNSSIDTTVNLENSVYLQYNKNYQSDTIEIMDEAGNKKSVYLEISQIDEQGPNVDVTYTTGGVTYNSRNYTTNKDVTVTLTSDESVKEVEGWTRSQDGKQLTKTYLVTENPSGKTEKVLIKDNFGNVTTKPVYIKIDTEKPYVTYPKEELSSHNGVLAVNITFNEICTIVSGDGWAKPASGGPNMISKTFTGATSEEGENVIVKDAAGNECEIGIRVRNDNGMLVAEIFDTTPPILEKIMYGTTSITNMNVRVTLIVNEKTQEIEGWDLQEGTGEYESKWILTRLYSGNIEENVEIADIDGNKIVGNNLTNNSVTNGKVKIKITNIDKEAPQINDNYETVPESGTNNVVVTLTANEAVSVKEGANWRISNSGNGVGTKITGTMQKGTTDIIKIADRAGNTEYFKVTCNDAGTNVTVNTGALVSISKSPRRKTNSDVTVGITVNKKIGKINNKNISNGETVDGWKLTENIQGGSNNGYLTKTFSANGDYEVQIEDIDGNKVIGEDIINGVVRFSIDNIIQNVVVKEISNITIKESPKTVYYQGDMLDLTGLKIEVTYVDETSEIIEYTEQSELEIYKDGRILQGSVMLTQAGPRQVISVKYGDKSAWFYILVNVLEIVDLNVKNAPNKINYKVGEELNTEGLVLEATYNSGKKADIIEGYNVKDISLNTSGGKSVDVTYEGETTSFKINVGEDTPKTIWRISLEDWPGRYIEYVEGEELDLEGLKISVKYSDGTSEIISYVDGSEGITVTPRVLGSAGEPIIAIRYNGRTITPRVKVVEKNVTNIRLLNNPTKQTYNIGDTVDLTGVKLEVTYDNGQTVQINDTELEDYGITCMPMVLWQSGDQYVAIWHKNMGVSYPVHVNEKEVKDFEVVKKIEKDYKKDSEFDMDSIELLVTYTDNSTDIIREGFTVEPNILANLGNQELVAKYGGKQANFSVNVVEEQKLVVEKVELIKSQSKTNYKVGEMFELNGLVIKVSYANNETREIRGENFSIIPNTFEEEGEQTITYNIEGTLINLKANVSKDGAGADSDTENKDDETNKDSETKKDDETNKDDESNEDDKVNKDDESNKDDKANKDDESNKSDKTNKDNNASNIVETNKNGEVKQQNVNKDTKTESKNYKDANTAKSRLPQTGISSAIIGVLILFSIVGGVIFITYKKTLK